MSEKQNIYQKLNTIQGKLKAPKSQYNSFGKYNYRNCEDILEALKPLLTEVGAVVIVSDEMVQIGERYYIKAMAKIVSAEGDGEITTTAYAREDESKKGMDASQVTGSTSSYARKYALNGLFAIDDTKDSDATNQQSKDAASKTSPGQQQSKPNSNSRKGKVNVSIVNTLQDLQGQVGMTNADLSALIKERYKAAKLSDLSVENGRDLYKHFKSLLPADQKENQQVA